MAYPIKRVKFGKREGTKLGFNLYCEGDFILRFVLDTFSIMIEHQLKKLTIIAHNFSGHDGILIMKCFAEIQLIKDFKVSIVLHDHKVYTVKIAHMFEGKKYYLTFQCRYLLLKSRLESLGSVFEGPDEKGYMPHRAVTCIEDLKLGLDHLLSSVGNSGKALTSSEITTINEIWNTNHCVTIIDYASAYCKLDVEVLSFVVISFIEAYILTTYTNHIGSYGDYITISRLAILT
jgi:hypothetical protein